MYWICCNEFRELATVPMVSVAVVVEVGVAPRKLMFGALAPAQIMFIAIRKEALVATPVWIPVSVTR